MKTSIENFKISVFILHYTVHIHWAVPADTSQFWTVLKVLTVPEDSHSLYSAQICFQNK